MKYIDVTPTWEGILPTLLVIYRDGTTVEARQTAMKELERMAKLADAYVAEMKGRVPA